jgi:aminoglycoside 6'-N-acetyltransferase
MVALLPFDPELHIGLLAQWLHREHVRERWGDPVANLESIVALTPPAGCALIAADGALVGFVQWQPMKAHDLLASGIDVPDDETIDLDIFIGEADYLGRGIGPAALKLLIKQIAAEGAAKRMTLFTGVENERALRAYAKAGFRVRSHYMDAEHGWTTVLMAEILS